MDIAVYTLKSVAYAVTDPTLVIVLVFLGFIFYTQNKKTTVMQKMIIGERLSSPLELTISQIVLGIFGGIVASIILSYLGVMFDENSGIEFIFLISILLMFWNPRFICFSYAGSILGLISIIVHEVTKYDGKGSVLDIVSLMSLIGVLHIVEGALVMIDGTKGAIPVFTNKDGKIIGGFALKRYWPIPIVIMLVIKSSALVSGGDAISTPDWWPLINLPYSVEFLKNAVIGALPLYGVLGYNSITFTRDKVQKSLLSGSGILIYGILLTAIAQLAAYGLIWQFVVIIFAPAAHEGMIRFQRYLEFKASPRYSSESDGITVLEVAPGSPAFQMGIQSGDRLLEINDKKILNESDIVESITGAINYIWFKVKKVSGKEIEVNFTNLSRDKRLGVVFVPKGMPKDSMVVKFQEGKFKEILDKIKSKDKEKDDDE